MIDDRYQMNFAFRQQHEIFIFIIYYWALIKVLIDEA